MNPAESNGPAPKQPGKLSLDRRGILEAANAPAAFHLSVMRWMSNCDRQEHRVRLERLIEEGKAFLVEVSAASVRSMADEGRLLYREGKLDRRVLDKINLPLNPSYLERPEHPGMVIDGPISLVAVGDDIAIPNGNHRVYKVAHQEWTSHPLLAVFFDGPKSYDYYSGVGVDWRNSSHRFPKVGFSGREHNL